MKKLWLCFAVAIFLLLGSASLESSPREDSPAPAQEITVDANAPARPFPHFWEKMFGSGRAILSLRESYRNDLREAKRITGFEYVRFHAIFHDEVGVYDEDKDGQPIYNFSYVDQIPRKRLRFISKILAAPTLPASPL